jgi:Ca2+-binding EF-hand superfamily protein
MNRAISSWFVAGLVLLAIGWNSRQAAAQDPSEFLKRLDTNNNGMIDPSELEGRFGSFVQRMAENNPRLDFSRPVPISRVAEEFTRMREERGQGGGGPPFGGTGGGPPGGGPPGSGFQGRGGPPGGGAPGGGPPGGGPPGRGGGDQSGRGGRGDEQNNPYRPTTTKVAPLVPGFGEEAEMLAAPPGFGSEGELFAVKVTDQDRQEAARAFGYYDANKDGKIDREEMNRSRYGADLLMYDQNRDGVITLNEMEYRYARRRVENTRNAGGGGGSPQASDTADRGGRGNRDAGRGGGDGGRGGDRRATGKEENPNPFANLNSYRIVPPVERLPAGLPDWFARNDADGDGQISMAEFSATWTDAVLADFLQFDLNRDGLITPDECLKAGAAGAQRGAVITVAAAESSDASPETAGSDQASAGAAPAAASSGPGPAIDPRYLDYYKKLVAKYDTNKDGVLTKDEWSNMSKDPAAADANRDGKITVEEFARWSMQR